MFLPLNGVVAIDNVFIIEAVGFQALVWVLMAIYYSIVSQVLVWLMIDTFARYSQIYGQLFHSEKTQLRTLDTASFGPT